MNLIIFKIYWLLLFVSLICVPGCARSNEKQIIREETYLLLMSVKIGEQTGLNDFKNLTSLTEISMLFNLPLDQSTIKSNVILSNEDGKLISYNYSCKEDGSLKLQLTEDLKSFSRYKLFINRGLKSVRGPVLPSPKTITLSTELLDRDCFPRLAVEDLLSTVQKNTFQYFWEGADPISGMAKERTSLPNIVTTGGTGFGIMSICVAAERHFITRVEACERINKIVSFLHNKATTYHGAFAHWIYGDSGETKPFSVYDDGADLVETAFLFQGLLTARSYFDGTNDLERSLRKSITELWEAVDWNFFTKEGTEDVLYWHWSPSHSWIMNMPIRGWNEALIVYVLAASSPTHPISKDVYERGWCQCGKMQNGKIFNDVLLPLGSDFGGPLFFEHYSFMGLDPRRISDKYVNYWEQVCSHARINYNYCVENPHKYLGYSSNCWGLTASDTPGGYTASSPTNDVGTIAPTASLSSFPYTPKESMQALEFYYYKLGDRLWSDYGFIDAFNLTSNWFDESEHLAIDQGPIVVMIENYRTGLLWNVFMKNNEIIKGLEKLGFIIRDLK